MKEKISKPLSRHSPRARTESVVELLVKEKEPFINRGSVDILAKYTVDTLREFGLKINFWESLSTSGKISDAITNNPGVTSVFGYSLITTNAYAINSAVPGALIGTERTYGLNSPQAAIVSVGRNIVLRSEDVSLVTTGDILEKGSDVHVALMTKKQLRLDRSPPPAILTIKIEDFERDLKDHPEYLKGATLNSLKKQYVTHRALLFLLKELGRPADLPFKPRQTKEEFLIYRTHLLKTVVKKMLEKNFKLGIAESATGGRLVDAITDVENGQLILGKCTVLYNEKEKLAAGVPADSLTDDAVYSTIAAYELARTAMGNDSNNPDTQVQIGFTGLLDKKDNRNSRTKKHKRGSIYYAIMEKGKKAHAKFIEIAVRNKLEMKEISMIIVYRHLLQILNERFSPERSFE